MTSQRKIAHKIAELTQARVNRTLSPDGIRSFINSSSSSLNQGLEEEFEVESSDFHKVVMEAWSESVIESLNVSKSRITSDYILDLIEKVEEYLSSNYSKEELDIFVSIIEKNEMKKLLKDEKFFCVIDNCRETFSKEVIKSMHSEYCMNLMKKKIEKIMSSPGYDDKR